MSYNFIFFVDLLICMFAFSVFFGIPILIIILLVKLIKKVDSSHEKDGL